MSFSIKLLTAALAALFWSAALYAADVGSVRGVVHDQEHHPIRGAQVALKSATSQWTQSAVTDARGEFSFMTVPLGDYILNVSGTDFVPRAQAVSVASGSSPIAHVQLAKGPPLETVTVIVAEVPTLPAASYAFDTMVCDPFATAVVFHEKVSDVAFVFEVCSVPSM